MNQESHPQPSYYAVIPSEVRYCKSLEPSAKLLYGEITALCNKEGFCWASNAYFADLYGVDDRTVRRWLESLEENDFIKKEITRGFNSTRKIFINHNFQKSFTNGQKCPEGGTKMSGGADKNVRHNTTMNNTSDSCSLIKDQISKETVSSATPKVDLIYEQEDSATPKVDLIYEQEDLDALVQYCSYKGIDFSPRTLVSLLKKYGKDSILESIKLTLSIPGVKNLAAYARKILIEQNKNKQGKFYAISS